tara:strand:+ start:230 stop:388 length:159 start_codon:yes stop_codon:yes gene_type:complete
MVKQVIIKFCYKAVEWRMLRIYAIIMTGVFLSVWIPAMVNVVYQLLKIYSII